MTMVTKVILKANTSQIKPVAQTGSILIMIMTMYLYKMYCSFWWGPFQRSTKGDVADVEPIEGLK
jgi:hypothetical protein